MQLAAHFDVVRRITIDHAGVALVNYGGPVVDDDRIDARFQRLYRDEIGPYWPAGRRLVDSDCAGIDSRSPGGGVRAFIREHF